ncbi:GntR family transcriptional regulator [Mameliella alba]|nr:GntR family transcriptional regulator [Antarctobacter heliothermus]MBY6143417.1 GntR family transcriptional regulator [Mameliella alba]MCA0952858.1 GntR family transcriptional regulator [Mameliella alba]
MSEQDSKEIDTGSLVDRLVVVIHDAIISGELAPEAPIRPKTIANQPGVSMIPVLEALARLLASRLVHVEPNRGYFVAAKPTPADIRKLRRLNGKMRAIVSASRRNVTVEWGTLNSEFHQTLVGLARNVFVDEQYRNLSFGLQHFQLAQAANVEFTSLSSLVEQHDGMIDALEKGGKPLLLCLLSQHINNLSLSD